MANHLTDGEFTRPPHVNLLNRKLVDLAFGRLPRLICSVPVRHAKSTTISHYFPVWLLSLFPRKRIILASYGADFAADWGRKVRNTIEEHSRELGITLSEDSQAKDRWNTPQGGGMISAGVGGSFTGRGADVIIVDDPYKNDLEAFSDLHREKVWNWWEKTLMTRLEPGGAVILTMARWHADDLVGKLLEEDKANRWEELKLPAIAGEDDPLGRRPGEALWPERYDEAALADKKIEVGAYAFAALYQQEPPSLDGVLAYQNYDDREGRNRDSRVKLLEQYPLDIAIDFNRNPGMHAVVGQYLAHEDTATARYVIHAPRMTIQQMIGRNPADPAKPHPGSLLDLVNREGGWKWRTLNVYGDATGRISQMSDGKSNWDVIAAELKEAGIPFEMHVPASNPGVQDRVNVFNNALLTADGRIRYKVHPDCDILIRDFKKLRLDGNEPAKQVQLLSHSSDADGYRLVYIMPIRKLTLGGGRVRTLNG